MACVQHAGQARRQALQCKNLHNQKKRNRYHIKLCSLVSALFVCQFSLSIERVHQSFCTKKKKRKSQLYIRLAPPAQARVLVTSRIMLYMNCLTSGTVLQATRHNLLSIIKCFSKLLCIFKTYNKCKYNQYCTELSVLSMQHCS